MPEYDNTNREPEYWRPIRGFEGRYEVSSYGRVKSVERVCDTAKGVRTVPSIIRALRETSHGYFRVGLHDGSSRSEHFVHALVLDAFVGPRPRGMQCRHLDGNGLNNLLSNLTWGTPQENAADKELHGTSYKGDRHWSRQNPHKVRRGSINNNAKLSEDIVREIRRRYRPRSSSDGAIALAREFRVSRQAITNIVSGKVWGGI